MVGSAADRIRQLEEALESRTVIGQAVGMLMERYEMESTAAFAALRRTSNELNLKLRDVAEVLVTTRRLPSAGDR